LGIRIGKQMLDENQQIQFTRLWTDAQPTVSQFVASLVRDPWAVRDIVQNVSLVLLRKFAEYDESKSFLPWALGIAKFEILGHQRDAARNRLICDSLFLDQYTQAWADIAPRISHEMEALRHCVGELDGRPRTIIKLRYADGETSETIAAKLNITAENVRTILHRTRDVLRRCVERHVGLQGESA
jgi:RNA polymerase sigma-70 factor, ECF subfamily